MRKAITKGIAGLVGLSMLGLLFSTFVEADTIQMQDDFESYTDELILADTNCYTFANFPNAGSDDGTCNSSNWENDTGSIVADIDSGGNNWMRTVGDGDGLWRPNTQQTAQEMSITWRYKAASANNATDVWARYQTQYWLYAIQFDRSDNCIIAKRKIPTNTSASNEWGGVAAGFGAAIANKGVYYTLKVDADSPAYADSRCGVDGRTWAQSGFSSTVHDATLNGGTVYSYELTITTIAPTAPTCGKSFSCVQIQLFRDGVLAISWTDGNDGYNYLRTRTAQQDCDAGWFTTVTGYTADWCSPIYAAGKSGFRNDTSQVAWFDDVVMTEVTAGDPFDTTAPTPNPATFSSAPNNASASSVTMTATAGSDSTTPIEYFFNTSVCDSNQGTGDTASAWQQSNSYTDSGLQPNKCYGYTIQMRDSVTPTPNTGTASSRNTTYTSANTPNAPTVTAVTDTTITFTNGENSNPSSNPTTNFAVQVVNTTDSTWNNQYVDASGNPSATAVWRSDSAWDGTAINGLDPNTTYGIKAKARNNDSDETSFGGTTTQLTESSPPAPSVTGKGAINGGTVRLNSANLRIN